MKTSEQVTEHGFKLDRSVPAIVTIERINGIPNDKALEDSVHALCAICENYHSFKRGDLIEDATKPGHADVLNLVAKDPSTQVVYEDRPEVA